MRVPKSVRRRFALGVLLVSAVVLAAVPVGAAAAVVAARVADAYQVSAPVNTTPACSAPTTADDSEWSFDEEVLGPADPLYIAWDTQGADILP
ncbi:hypothetical protein [Catenulispora rubra]|uniref:hypothetical protein n=1 Tax=Catenulispora rubra TaxID=280293 RepID=UPI001892233C|nr:hypothetical protein [Catenulispora rubra]